MIVWSAAKSMWTEPAVAVSQPGVRGRDQILAAIVLVVVLAEAIVRPDVAWRPAAIGLGCLLAIAILICRIRPLVAAALAFGGFAVVDVATGVSGGGPIMLYTAAVVLIVVYSLFRWAAGRDVLLGLGIVAVEFTISTVTDFSGAGDALGGAAVLLFTAALGAAIRFRTMAREHLMEQAKLLEREQLARELHDTVAHHVSAIAVQAQAGLVLARSSSPAGAAGALEIIDGGAAQTLAEMRAMVATLRDRHSQASPDPRCHLNDIELLGVVRTGSALSVDVSLHGDLTGLPQALEAALYRVAQETVTNSRRHARLATRVEVAVIGKDSEVELTVKDDGESATRSRSGYGLIGMTERVTLLGGTLTAGPAPDHGWCVRAVFPRPRIRK